MSQRDSFLGGFLLGTVVGGAVGGILGAVVSSRLANDENSAEFPQLKDKTTRKRQLKPPTEQSIEAARRGLEDKIAELNEAIDDVRQQLSSTNGAPIPEGGRAIASRDEG
jgi:gas vesicle protein